MSESEVTIEPIHTACKNCVYATYENITQTDCALGYISKFRDKQLQILEAYDDDKEFYVINNKKCIGYRDDAWFKSRKLDHLTLEEKIQRHFDTNYIKYTLLINLSNFITEEKLNKLIEHLCLLKIKPSNVVFIRFHGKNLELHDIDHIQDILNRSDLKNTPWRVQTMLDEDITQDGLVYECVKSIKKRFLLTITDIPTDIDAIVDSANTIVSNNMDSFNLISNKDKTAILFPVSVYKYHLYQLKKDLFKQNELYTIV